jgi:O-antigen ligase
LALGLVAAMSPRYALFLVAGGLVASLVFRSLLAGLAIFVILTFPEALPGSLGVGPTLAKPLGVIVFVSWLMLILGDRDRAIPFLPRDAPVLTSLLLCFLLWSVCSLAWASDRSLTLHGITRLFQLEALVFVVYSAVRTSKDLLVLVGATLVGALITSVYALANGTVAHGRLTGALFNPNALATRMVVAIFLAMFFFVTVRRLSLRLVLLAAISIFAITLVQTQSRSGILALGAGSLVAVFVAGRIRGRIVAMLLIAGAVGFSYYFYAAPAELRARIASIGTSASEASPGRADTWRIATKMTRDHPLAGVGLANFPAQESRYFATTINVVDVRSLRRFNLVVHNTYLEIAAELGIVGLLLFVAILAGTVGRAAVLVGLTERSSALDGLVVRALLAASAGLLTSNIFGSGEYEKTLWFLLGLLVAAVAPKTEPAAEPARSRRLYSAMLPRAA